MTLSERVYLLDSIEFSQFCLNAGISIHCEVEIIMSEQRKTLVDRRRFLQTSIALGAAASVYPWAREAMAAGGDADKIVVNASHWGAFKAKVKDGKVADVDYFDFDTNRDPNMKALVEALTSPSRIKYPMVRAGFLKDGAKSASKRGSEEFVRVSWDQALDLAAKELKRVKEEHGNTAFFGGSYGWKSIGKVHNCRTMVGRFLNLHGGCTLAVGNYSVGADIVIMPYVLGTQEVNDPQTTWSVLADKAEQIVLWGADPLTTGKIDWIMPDGGIALAVQSLKDKKVPFINIDPVQNQTAKFVGAEWIAPRPSTDVAMMLGIAHTLYAEKLHNEKFLKDYTTGFDKFLEYLTGKSDGKAKSAEWAAEICEVPADKIKDLARRFAGKRTFFMSGWSMQRQDHGEQAHWMLTTLCAMIGQIGLPGGGFSLGHHYSNGGAALADAPAMKGISLMPAALTSGGAAADEKGGKYNRMVAGTVGSMVSIPLARIVDMLESPGTEIDFNGKKIKYPDIKMIYWAGGNPFAHHQDVNRMVEAWKKPECVIVHDIFWTPTARHADIVFPATTTFERDDIEQGGSFSLKYIIAMKKVIEPMFEARDDLAIFDALAKRLGYGDAFTEGRDAVGWVKFFYEDALEQAKKRNIPMPDFDTFWNKEFLLEFKTADKAKSYVRYADFRNDPLMNPLGTPSGKIEIFSKSIEKFGYDDCGPHPTWYEPAERLGTEKAKKHPMALVSSHPNGRLHSQLCGVDGLRKTYAVSEREPVLINPVDAKARDIKSGDIVRIFNDRGQLLAGAVVTEDVRPGAFRLCEGGWYDPAEPGKAGTLDVYGNANTLTLDKGTSKLAQATMAHTALAQIEKYKGEAPKVMAFVAPKNG